MNFSPKAESLLASYKEKLFYRHVGTRASIYLLAGENTRQGFVFRSQVQSGIFAYSNWREELSIREQKQKDLSKFVEYCTRGCMKHNMAVTLKKNFVIIIHPCDK